VVEKKITLRYKTTNGIETKNFTALFTHHGPVLTRRNGQWLSLRADNRLINGLMQCWLRNKARSFKEFKKTLDLLGNISNNTVYADAEGNIAYWHGNRIPVRNKNIDWSKPVDGTTKTTEWKGLHKINETVHIINPSNGWLQNCNSTPFTAAGSNSPKKENFPAYMAPDGENFRGINAVRVLSGNNKYTIDKVIAAGYDTRLAAFEVLMPALIKAYENANYKTDYSFLSEPIKILKSWDYKSAENSVATTLAVHFGEKLQRSINAVKAGIKGEDFVSRCIEFANTARGNDLLNAFSDVLDSLKKKYGDWKIAWGEINRFQRISGDIKNKFDDKSPSLPVGFAASTWGMLSSFVSRSYPGTQKRYGYNGNSFVCAVEFVRKPADSLGEKKIKARSLLTGGQSGDPNSTHFFDQGLMYTKGQFKDVLFYKDDVLKQAERTYHPGE
jgi:acyl-homoserine lactone acylase PvdQ